MKLIYRIAKAELRMLFCSPVAWFLLVIFTLQTALFFTGRYEWFMKGNERKNDDDFHGSVRERDLGYRAELFVLLYSIVDNGVD